MCLFKYHRNTINHVTISKLSSPNLFFFKRWLLYDFRFMYIHDQLSTKKRGTKVRCPPEFTSANIKNTHWQQLPFRWNGVKRFWKQNARGSSALQATARISLQRLPGKESLTSAIPLMCTLHAPVSRISICETGVNKICYKKKFEEFHIMYNINLHPCKIFNKFPTIRHLIII